MGHAAGIAFAALHAFHFLVTALAHLAAVHYVNAVLATDAYTQAACKPVEYSINRLLRQHSENHNKINIQTNVKN